MHALGDAVLLSLWERGRDLDQVGRALLLAGAAGTPDGRDCAELSIGERDAAIARLRTGTFGPHLHGCLRCDACGEWIEFDFDCGRMLAEFAPPRIAHFEVAGLRFRLPDSRDLIQASRAQDAVDAGRRVLAQCCLDAKDVKDWSDTLIREAEARIGQFDPGADVRLDLRCAACAAPCSERLDIAAFFWDEIELRAQRLLDEVHCLAIAYGWSEAQILALGDRRRRAYLQRCAP